MGRLIQVNATLNDHSVGRLSTWLKIEFELKSCHKHFTALWIELYEPRSDDNFGTSLKYDSRFMKISKDCLTKRGDTFSITLPSAKKDCIFPLMDLVECKTYNMKLIPIYQGFQGQSPPVIYIPVPPQVIIIIHFFNELSITAHYLLFFQIPGDSSNLISLKTTSRYGSILAEWSVQSKDCARLLTSVDTRIYEEDQANSSNPLRTSSASSTCLSHYRLQNQFEIGINETSSYCYNSTGLPLEMCRSYTLEVQPNYLSNLQGRSSFVDFFTTGRGIK